MPSLLGLLKNNDLALQPSVIIFKKASKLGHYPIHRAPLGLTRIVQKIFICLSSFLSEGLQGGGGGGGVLVSLFPSKIGLCFLVPAFFSHLFPAFLICSSLPPPTLESGLAFCFKISHSDWYILFISVFALVFNNQRFQMLLLSVKSTRKTSCSLDHRFQFQMTKELLISPCHLLQAPHIILKPTGSGMLFSAWFMRFFSRI